jgi:hypothetical protein
MKYPLSKRVGIAVFSALFCMSFAFAACKGTNQHGARYASTAQGQTTAHQPPASGQFQIAPCKFEWIDAKTGGGTWETVSAAFKEELRPDQSSDNPQAIFYPLKKIIRIGGCGDAVFVTLEKRSTQKEWGEPFGPAELYNFNLLSRAKSKIEERFPFWAWKYRQLARFDDAPAPDITFESATCSNCDAALTLLSTLRFNPKDQKWELRRWVQNDPGITIYDMNQESDAERYQTISGIADFDGKGYDELAVWTHVEEAVAGENGFPRSLPPVTSVTIFSFRDGAAFGVTISEVAEVRRIRGILCKLNSDAEACKNLSAKE